MKGKEQEATRSLMRRREKNMSKEVIGEINGMEKVF